MHCTLNYHQMALYHIVLTNNHCRVIKKKGEWLFKLSYNLVCTLLVDAKFLHTLSGRINCQCEMKSTEKIILKDLFCCCCSYCGHQRKAPCLTLIPELEQTKAKQKIDNNTKKTEVTLTTFFWEKQSKCTAKKTVFISIISK